MTRWTLAVREALEAILRRPGRTVLTTLSVTVSVAILLATLGIAGNGTRVVQQRFDAYASRSVTVEGWTPGEGDDESAALRRLADLRGVTSTATVREPVDGDVAIALHPAADPTRVELLLVGGDGRATFEADMVTGRWWDEAMVQRCDPVIILGETAAGALGVGPGDLGRVIQVGSSPRVLIGIARSPSIDPSVQSQALWPWSEGCPPPWPVSPPTVLARTDRGAAGRLAPLTPLALDASAAPSMSARTELEPTQLRQGALADSQRLLLALALAALVVAVVVITITLMASVGERRIEIGVRRAVGASRSDILRQVLIESGTLGLIGAAQGLLLGVAVTLHHGILNEVPGAVEPAWVPLAAAAGLSAGVLGGLTPALRASRVDPAAALTSS